MNYIVTPAAALDLCPPYIVLPAPVPTAPLDGYRHLSPIEVTLAPPPLGGTWHRAKVDLGATGTIVMRPPWPMSRAAASRMVARALGEALLGWLP